MVSHCGLSLLGQATTSATEDKNRNTHRTKESAEEALEILLLSITTPQLHITPLTAPHRSVHYWCGIGCKLTR